MDKLIAALVMEVRLRDGQPQCGPISKGLAGNMELRIKGWLAAEFGICKPASVLADNDLAHHRSKSTPGYDSNEEWTPRN